MTDTVIKWGKKGDQFEGELLSVRETKDPNSDIPGKQLKIYAFRATKGSFHNIVDRVVDAEPTTVNDGDIVTVFGRVDIDRWMEFAKPGQQVGMRFAETFKTKGGFDGKMIKVSLDDEFVAKPEPLVDQNENSDLPPDLQ